jgi:hypothetical protein
MADKIASIALRAAVSMTVPPDGDGIAAARLPTTCSPSMMTLAPRSWPISHAPARNEAHDAVERT